MSHEFKNICQKIISYCIFIILQVLHILFSNSSQCQLVSFSVDTVNAGVNWCHQRRQRLNWILQSLCPSLNVTVYMHNQGDLELLTLWIVGKGGKCHKKNHHFDCSLYSIHSIDMTDLTIESNENREKRFAYLVLLLGYFIIRHFFIPRQQLHLYVSHKILLRTKLLRFQ